MTSSNDTPVPPHSDSSAPERTPSQNISAQQIRAYERRLRRLASELSLAEARERREIASDLHDHIGQALAYVSQKVSILQGNAVFCGMEDDFSEILSILDQAIRYTRDLTVEISPPVLYELGLPAAIDWLAERAHRRYGIKVVTTQTGKPKPVADDIKVFMFKAIHELITNVAKHAAAKRVTVRTVWQEEAMEIHVTDDGCGFDSAPFNGGSSADGCFGLFSIRERLSYAGGKINIDSTPGKGTCVTVSTPYRIAGEVSRD